jgi:pro-kumamolisin-like protein/Big-like domain-containing protein
MSSKLGRSRILIVRRSIAVSFLLGIALCAQEPSPRLGREIDNSLRVTLPGTHPPMAKTENDAGELPSGTMLHGISVVLSRSAAQESDLEALLAAQQSLGSPEYHKWLSPDEFAARFGVADSDISAIRQWLEQQGLTFLGVSRSKNRIVVSGTTEQLRAAFGLALHDYTFGGEKHYAPSSDVTVPAALAPLIESVANLSTFRPRPRVKLGKPRRAQAKFTSSQSGSHFLTPKDIATIYNLDPAYGAGYTGSDQAIAVVGQSSVVLSDIEHFQTAAGFSKKDPTLVLVPNSGSATVVSGDEAESDLDLEYTSTIGRDATIYFVYVGNNPNYSVWDSIEYAVDQKVAPIISVSYGICETALSSGDYASLNAVLAQAAAQGQTIVAASGDSGATDCYGLNFLTATEQKALAVDFPASSQYVTGMGGTEFLADDVGSSNTTYWTSASGSDVVGSARSYIPEQVWNDSSSSNGLAAGGGGVSSFTARPGWQTGVAGIPSGNYRLLPDISLDSSADNAGYLYCSSDSQSTGVTGSCSNGFRDSNSTYLTVAGGTSFASPIFAGMLSLINQKLNSDGQGVINSILYTLAANSSTYSSAFHDVTIGNNKCTAGSTYCSSAGASEYSAGTGYDQASGLGSVDFYNLLMAWPNSNSSTVPSSTTLAAASTTPSTGESDTVTITVASASSSVTTIPTGTLTILVDGTTVSSDLALADGSATYRFSSNVAGSHTVTASYSGDSTFASSSGSLSLTVGGEKTFTLSGTNVTVSAGSSSGSTITVTPKNGYTGTIAFTVSSSPSLTNGCFSLANATVSGSSAVTATLTVSTSSSACASASIRRAPERTWLAPGFRSRRNFRPYGACGILLLWAAILSSLVRHRQSRRPSLAGAVLLLAGAAFAAAGCSSTTSSTHNASKGTYTVTIVGSDVATPSITATTTIRVTVD